MDKVTINTASVDQLCNVRGIGLKQGEAIIYHREIYGPMTNMFFSIMMMGAVYEETWNQLDFSVPSWKQIKRKRADTNLPLLLTSLEAEATELGSQISETEFQLSKLLTQSEDRPVQEIQGFQQSLMESHKVLKIRKILLLHKPPSHQPITTVNRTGNRFCI